MTTFWRGHSPRHFECAPRIRVPSTLAPPVGTTMGVLRKCLSCASALNPQPSTLNSGPSSEHHCRRARKRLLVRVLPENEVSPRSAGLPWALCGGRGGNWNSGGHCEVRWPLQGQASPSLLRLQRNKANPGTDTGTPRTGDAGGTPEARDAGGVPGEGGFVDETGAMAETAMRVMQAAGVPVLDIWPLSHMRPDGHPAKYYNWGNPTIQDCRWGPCRSHATLSGLCPQPARTLFVQGWNLDFE